MTNAEPVRKKLFASARERRLWGWSLAAVLAIYSTLGLERALAVRFADTGIGEATFVFCCLLVLAMVVTQGFRVRPGGAGIGVALGVAAVYALVFARMTVPTERSHLIEYGVVALLVREALLERAGQGRRVPAPSLLAIAAAIDLGVLDECLQLFVPGRSFDPRDMLFNALAAVMAVAGATAIGRARRR